LCAEITTLVGFATSGATPEETPDEIVGAAATLVAGIGFYAGIAAGVTAAVGTTVAAGVTVAGRMPASSSSISLAGLRLSATRARL